MSVTIEIEGVELEFDIYGENRPATLEDPPEYVEVELISGELPEGVTMAEAERIVLDYCKECRDEQEAEDRIAYREWQDANDDGDHRW